MIDLSWATPSIFKQPESVSRITFSIGLRLSNVNCKYFSWSFAVHLKTFLVGILSYPSPVRPPVQPPSLLTWPRVSVKRNRRWREKRANAAATRTSNRIWPIISNVSRCCISSFSCSRPVRCSRSVGHASGPPYPVNFGAYSPGRCTSKKVGNRFFEFASWNYLFSIWSIWKTMAVVFS